MRERGELAGSQVEKHYGRDALDRAAVAQRLTKGGGRPRRRSRETTVLTLGGDLYEGNWTTAEPPAAYRYLEPPDDESPPHVTTADGRPFRLVGQSPRWAWTDAGVAELLVFFESETRTVLLTLEF